MLRKKPSNPINPIKVLKKNLVEKLTGELEDKEVKFFKPIDLDGDLDINNRYLTLPNDITNSSSKDLGRYLNTFTQYKLYIRTFTGWQEISLEESKREYFNSKIGLYKEYSIDKKMSETAKEVLINNCEEVKPYFMKMKDDKKKLLLLYNNLESISDAIFSISREMSRRGLDFRDENRNENMQKK